MKNPTILIGYLLGGGMLILGLLIVTGVVTPGAVQDPTLVTIFGIILLLFGLYRMAVTDTKRRAEERSARNHL